MDSILFSCIESRIKNKRNHFASFQIGPFFRLQAITFANTLRRILLSDLISINVVAVNIIGATHEYSLLLGIRESVLDILLNLKQLVFAHNEITNNSYYFGYLRVKGPKIVKASDILLPNTIMCVDCDQYIATLSYNGRLFMKLKLNNIINKSIVIEKKAEKFSPLLSHYFNFIFKSTQFPIILDSNFTSVNKVNYIIDSINNLEEYDNFIFFDIWTNGSISPRNAIQNSIYIIINLFLSIYNVPLTDNSISTLNDFLKVYLVALSNKSLFLRNVFSSLSNNIKHHNNVFSITNDITQISIDELNISLQLKFCLKRYAIYTIEDLLKITKKDLLVFLNCTEECINKIELSLKCHNLYMRA